VEPPVAVIELLFPTQIVAAVVVVVMIGAGLTVIVLVAVFVHPAVFPVTVYVVVVNGETVIVAPDKFPGIQLYEDAPLAVIEVLFPAQIVPDVVVVVTVGLGLTVIILVADFVQPFAPVPITVYVVVMAGLIVIVAPDKFPGIHV